jgi:hypothetical protein
MVFSARADPAPVRRVARRLRANSGGACRGDGYAASNGAAIDGKH